MIEIAHSREKAILKNMSQEVQQAIERILEIIDTQNTEWKETNMKMMEVM